MHKILCLACGGADSCRGVAMRDKVCDTLILVCCACGALAFVWIAVPTNEYFDNQK